MKFLVAAIAIAAFVLAAAFAWQTSMLAMADDHGHEMGMECLAYCLMAGADKADVAATAAATGIAVFLVVTAVLFFPTFVPAPALSWRAPPSPGTRKLFARLD